MNRTARNPLFSQNGKTWIVVADEAGAKVFSLSNGHLHLLRELTAPSEAVPGLTDDRIGRNAGAGGQQHKYEPSFTASRQVSIEFAKNVCYSLSVFSKQSAFESLVLVAAPRMLGLLRANLEKETQEKIMAEIDKELTGQDLAALEKALPGLIEKSLGLKPA